MKWLFAPVGRAETRHNLYLWILKETGLLGAIPFFIGLWLCWRSVWKARGSAQGTLPLACLVFMLVINMNGTYLYYKLFWLVLAYALASGGYALASAGNSLQTFPVIAKRYTGRRRWRKSFT